MAITDDAYVISSFDLQLANMWDFYIVNNPADFSIFSGLTNATGLLGTLNVFESALSKFFVKSVNIPGFSFNIERNPDFTLHHTEFEAPSSMTASFYETTTFSTYRYLKSWMESIYDSKKKVFKKNSMVNRYKMGIAMFYGSINVAQFTSKQEGSSINFATNLIDSAASTPAPNLILILDNLTIKGIDDFSLDEESSGPLMIGASFECEIPKIIF